MKIVRLAYDPAIYVRKTTVAFQDFLPGFMRELMFKNEYTSSLSSLNVIHSSNLCCK